MADMTVAQAGQLLAGDPSQEELFAAMLTLYELDQVTYAAHLGPAAELLSEQSGQTVTADQVNQVVRGLTEQTASEGGLTVEGLSELAGLPPPPPGEEGVGQAPPIGVPEGFTIPREDQAASDRAFRRAQGVPDQIEPRYRAGDEWDPSRLSPVEIRRRQKQLEKSGLLEPGYTPGFWDKASADALFLAMGYANIQGGQVENIISELEQLRPSDRDKLKKFVPPPEVKHDPAAIAQRVKREFRSQLGREPTDGEMAGFAGYLRGQYAAAHDALVAQERAIFDVDQIEGPPEDEAASDRALRRVQGLPDAADRTVGPFTDVDPDARFRERFEARFGPEIDRLAALPETRENMNNVFSSLKTMGSLVG
jgi:hypothetical protein